jgi:hypothetical protein
MKFVSYRLKHGDKAEIENIGLPVNAIRDEAA